jgi:hypothetical protein
VYPNNKLKAAANSEKHKIFIKKIGYKIKGAKRENPNNTK